MKKQVTGALLVLSIFIGITALTRTNTVHAENSAYISSQSSGKHHAEGESVTTTAGAGVDVSAITARIKALMAEIQKLRDQVKGNNGTHENEHTASSTNPHGPRVPKICKNIPYGHYGRGMSGEGVKGIQSFLNDEGDLDDDSVSGFFGQKTEKAMGAWQERHGVVAGGSAYTSGKGMFGEQTRQAMSRRCNDGQNTTGTHASSTATFTLTPSAGKAPLTVAVSGVPTDVLKKMTDCKYAERSWFGRSGNGLTVDWGDGKESPRKLTQVEDGATTTVGTSCNDQVSKHTYKKRGTFTATIRSWHPGPTDAPVTDWQGTATVVVSASSTRPEPVPVDLATTTKVAQKAKVALAKKLDVFTGNITVVRVEAKTWSNGCLELSSLGQVCTQALVPGYKITLTKGTTTYIAHTNRDGSVIGFE